MKLLVRNSEPFEVEIQKIYPAYTTTASLLDQIPTTLRTKFLDPA
jgi:hypothetical protein